MHRTILLLALSTLFVAGCDSIAERVEDRFGSVTPKSEVFNGDQASVGAAVLATFKRLDFTVNRSLDNAGTIEASGHIRRSEALGDSRQLVAEVRLLDAGPGRTEVQILLTEQVEGSTPAGGGEQPLREHGFYGTFFSTMRQVLAEERTPH